MTKSFISNTLRTLGLLFVLDYVRFYLEKYRNRKGNAAFRKEFPNVILPPDYLMYESFQLNYRKYYTDSRGTAEWLKNHFEKHIRFANARILDWGCGPGRVIRHMPEVIGNQCQYYGTDYNKKSIAWCTKNITQVEFNLNGLEAKLPYESNFFDAIYGISIFTHLSEKMHYDWYNELYRVLKPGGVLFITTQGNRYKIKLSEPEKELFDRGQLVVRGKVKEGHRTYSAFHPKPFMETLFKNAEILEHIANEPSKGSYIPQDIWMVRKIK